MGFLGYDKALEHHARPHQTVSDPIFMSAKSGSGVKERKDTDVGSNPPDHPLPLPSACPKEQQTS